MRTTPMYGLCLELVNPLSFNWFDCWLIRDSAGYLSARAPRAPSTPGACDRVETVDWPSRSGGEERTTDASKTCDVTWRRGRGCGGGLEM